MDYEIKFKDQLCLYRQISRKALIGKGIKNSFNFCIFFLPIILLFSSPAWANQIICDDIKIKFNNHADQLIQEIDDVELCARPAAEYRDKVFSNLKYRANRLKTCVQMVKQGELGFDCSREFKKTVKANGGENCFKKLEVMKKSFKNFETLFSGYQSCLKINKN